MTVAVAWGVPLSAVAQLSDRELVTVIDELLNPGG